MLQLHDIPARDSRSRLLNVVVDTPKGSRNKYKYDEALGMFRVSRILPAGMQFPHDFGSIPRTRADDGDALDVLVLTEAPTFPGCLLNARLLGVLRAIQKEGGRFIRNDRLIAVPQTSVNHPAVRTVRDLDAGVVREIEHFFISYNRAQSREFKVTGRLGPVAAEALLKRGMRSFDQQSGHP